MWWTAGRSSHGLQPTHWRYLELRSRVFVTSSTSAFIFWSHTCCVINPLKLFKVPWEKYKVLDCFPPPAAWLSSSSEKCLCRAQRSRWRRWRVVCSDQRPLDQSVLGDRRFSLRLEHWPVQYSLIFLEAYKILLIGVFFVIVFCRGHGPGRTAANKKVWEAGWAWGREGEAWELLCSSSDEILDWVWLQCLSSCPVGLEDIVLSALVQEQVEGLTPPAISLMSPEKISVSLCFCAASPRYSVSSLCTVWSITVL